MSFVAKLQRAREVLEQQCRLSVRALGRELGVSGDELEEVVEELVDVQQVASREGAVLQWVATTEKAGGTPRSVAGPGHTPTLTGARKVVTVVFADLAGSTALHERIDPESARRLMESYYATLRAAIERRGGTVVKLLGDGVLAAFGVPQVAEDDAMRAVHAGVAMQDAFSALVAERPTVLGAVGLRVAINTGEVVVSEANDDVVGDPVNVAARLQQEARDGDVVLGEATRRLVDALVKLEPLGSFALRGRTEAVKAYRVVSLDPPARATTAAFVGRVQELGRIDAVYQRAVESPAAHLVVLLGSPGLGKSRLIGEFARRTGETATVVAARCDAAGGATFAPVADGVRELLGIEAGASPGMMRAAVEDAVPADDGERARIAVGIVGLLTGTPGSPEETFFVVRRFLAGLAKSRPVVLVIDDLQWAEPLLLDLVEHLVQWGRGLPLLVLIGARPELRELRSTLATPGTLVSDVLALDGLDAGAAMQLAASVIGAADLPAAVAAKVLATSEGNPLFIAELVRMLVDEGALTRDGDRWTVGAALATVEMPPTIHALLAARIERLAPAQRTTLERAAVVGRHFSRSAIAALLPDAGTGLDARLEALQRAELIERDTGWFLGEPALRFHHVLIRDAAYRRLLKGTRAELHERLASWIEARVGDAPEHDETIGRHLEEAHRLLGELGPIDDAGQRLGERAATRLAAAGRRALNGDDVALGAGLLGRALDRLKADDPNRADLALDWCESLLAAGDVTGAATAIDELGRLTGSSDRLRAWHACFVGHRTVLAAPEELSATAELVAAAATALSSLNDAAGEAHGHFVHALALARLGRVGACEASLDRALAAARRAGDKRRANTVLAIAPLAALWGPSPVTRASGRCLDVVRVLRITQGAPAVEAVALSCQGVLEALRGRSEAAHRMIASARTMVEELGIAQRLFETDAFAGFVALLEGDAPAAERILRGAYDGLRELGLGVDAARAAALLARAVLAQDRSDEAEALSHESEALAGDDLKAAIAWRGVRAEALARRGEHGAAIELAKAAVEIAASTDALLDHAAARLALAAALRAAGRVTEADAEDQQAIELWQAKGATLLAERARRATRTAAPIEVPTQRAVDAPRRRPVRANFAIEEARRIEAAVAARDVQALAAVYRCDVEIVDHQHGVEYGHDAIVERVRAVVEESTDGAFHHEPLATLGDFVALFRMHSTASGSVVYGVPLGATEVTYLLVIEADAQGCARRIDIFGEDALGEAVVRLYELHASSLSESAWHSRADRTAQTLRALRTPFDPDVLTPVLDPDVQTVDHRTLGTWNSKGARAALEQIRGLRDVSVDAVVQDEDVLALSPAAFLARRLHSGTERVGGGVYERQYLLLVGFGADGRLSRWEFFDVGDEARALARFDAVTAAEPAQCPLRRGLRPNAASELMLGIEAGFAARDRGAIEALLGDPLRTVEHPTGATYEREGQLESIERMLRVPNLEFRIELLGTLGASLCLGRRRVAASGTAGGRFDVAEYEMDHVVLSEADECGRLRRSEVFASDHLGDAFARLYERYAESLPEGPERTRAAAVAGSVGAWTGSTDPDVLARAITPSAPLVDHRVFATWSARDATELLRHFRLQRELAPDFAARVEDVLALEPNAFLVRSTYSGTDRASGGSFENRVCVLFVCGADGRVAHSEAFEAESEVEALARFQELTDRGEVDPFGNAASRADREFVRRFNARDWTGIEALAAPKLVFDERRRMLHNACGRDVWLEQLRVMFDVPASRFTTKLRATRGERLALSLHGFAGEVAGGGGPLAMDDHLVLHEVDRDGRIVAIVLFDLEAENAAHAELDRRFESGEGATFSHVLLAVRRGGLVRARDWQAWAAGLAPDFSYRDHRRLGFGNTVADAGALLHLLRSTVELAPDADYRDDHVRISPRGIFRQTALVGTRDGGAFENPMFLVFEVDEQGRFARSDTYDLEDRDRALARFAELGAPAAPRRFTNAATRAVDRGTAALAARDWNAFGTLMAPGFRHYDRTRIAQLESDGEEWLAAFRRMVEMTTLPPEYRLLATRGDRLALFEMLWLGAGGDVGPSEIEWRLIVEVNERGEHEAIVVYDPGDLDAAYAELDARYEAEQGDRLPASWTLVRRWARAVADRDWDAVTSCCAEGFVEHDHRSLSLLGVTQGAQPWIQVIRAVSDLAPDSQFRIHHFVPGERGYYEEGGFCGTREGGPFEIVINALVEVDDDGVLARVDTYDDDRVFESTRWSELGIPVPSPACAPAEPSDREPIVIEPNAASAWLRRFRSAFNARDWDAVSALFAPDGTYEDRQRLVRVSGGPEMGLSSMRARAEAGFLVERVGLLGTSGDRVAIQSMLWASGGDEDRSEVEILVVQEVDDTGRLVASINFDPGDTRAAQREAWARWVAIEPEVGAVVAPVGDVVDAFNEQDARKWRAVFADDVVVQDHRLAGMGRIDGADAYTESVVALWQLAPATRGEMGWRWQALHRHGAITVVHRTGTVPAGGGDFESEYLYLYVVSQGRIARVELFELNALDEALARFEELCP